jgi:hypothetical protein
VSNDRVDFTRSAANRIANVVRIVETGSRDGAPFRPGRAQDENIAPRVFRVGTFASDWDIMSTATVTFFNQTTTPNTVVATNLFVDVLVGTATSTNCAIARDGTAWYLIAAECREISTSSVSSDD